MSVKANQSAIRVLEVLETIAEHQPIGLTAISRTLELDKNTVQRALVTLAEAGWISSTLGHAKGWELTPRIHAVAHKSQAKNDVLLRAKVELEILRDESRETAMLILPDKAQFFVADVFESRQVLRSVPPIGTVISSRDSATAYAIMAHLSPAAQEDILGSPPDADLLRKYAQSLRDGYATARDISYQGITAMASPIFNAAGAPICAVALVGPTDRMEKQELANLGGLLLRAANRLSRGKPACSAR